jgi:hypothetical protein
VGVVFAVLVLFGSSNSQVTDPIAQAATLSSSTPGYRMNVGLTMSSPMLRAPIVASGNATVDLRDRAATMSFAIDLSQIPQAVQELGSTTMRMDMIVDGGVMYMQFPQALSNVIPSLGGKRWIKLDVAKVTGLPGLSSLGNNPTMSDPSHMLQYLRAASDGVTNEGHQQVDGVETTHYRATLSLDRLAAHVPSGEQAGIQRALSQLQQSTSLHEFPIDVWVDARHHVRRLVMSLSLHAGGGVALQETVTADIGDYGPQPRPMPPSADQVQDLSSLIHLGS